MKPCVLLVNRELDPAYPVLVQGRSGITYASSRWNNERSGQCATLTLEEYEKCINDLAAAWDLPRRKWVPHFVESTDTDTPSSTFTELTAELHKAQADVLALKERCAKQEKEMWEHQHPNKLRKIAKDAGINIEGLKTGPEIASAIMAHRKAGRLEAST